MSRGWGHFVTAIRKQGPGWARALDPGAPEQYQGRIAHTLLGTSRGVTYHRFNLYGRSGCPQECSALLTIALECAESLGEAACFIGGDFNITLEGHHMESALEWSGWSDLFKGEGGTCVASGAPSAIDHVLANWAGRGLARKAWIDWETEIHTHGGTMRGHHGNHIRIDTHNTQRMGTGRG